MGAVETATLQDWISRFGAAIAEKREWLTELDSAIGDADHGANMARGMTAVTEKLGAGAPTGTDDLLKTVGMTLVSSVGGASGPLYGTFFLRMGMSSGAVSSLDGPALAAALRAGLEGIVARGKPEAGDKTLFDAMAPAVDALDDALASG
ncbi:MAG TPA: dihydroxyacetone kinase subunit DhaL, partial [Microbacterium sp.]|nr:dihydroxyacetone kinase subunit DhaL [Microbacterium sp.]